MRRTRSLTSLLLLTLSVPAYVQQQSAPISQGVQVNAEVPQDARAHKRKSARERAMRTAWGVEEMKNCS